MTTETAPAYLGTLSTTQAYSSLQHAAEETLAGVTGQRIGVTPVARQHVSASDVARSPKDIYIELQFERPRDVHHSVVLLAGTADLAALFELTQEDDGSGTLTAESLLRFGDILSTCLDTIAPALTWLQPTPRAWLANLEPLIIEADGQASVSLPPPLMASDTPLYQSTVTLSVNDAVSGEFVFIFNESAEEALLGLADAPVATEQRPVAPVRAAATASAPPPPSAPGGRSSTPAPQASVQAAHFEPLGPEQTTGRGNSIDLIREVPLKVSVELGRTSLTVREVLALGVGSVVELNRLAGEPVDVLVNDRLIARGEVVMVDESFGVRITDLIRPQR